MKKEITSPYPYLDAKKRKPIKIDRAVWKRMSIPFRIKMFDIVEITEEGGDKKDGEHS